MPVRPSCGMFGFAVSAGLAGTSTLQPTALNTAGCFLAVRPRQINEKGAGRTIRHTLGSRSFKTTPTWDFNYEAIAIVAKIPWARYGSVEVQPTLKFS